VERRSRYLPVSLVLGLTLVPAFSPSPGFGSVQPGRATVSAADGSGGGSRASALATLRRDLDTILSDHRLDGAQAAVVVRDATTGASLYSRNAGERLMPGSTEKLLTTFAALDVLGPAYRFRTSVFTDGTAANGVVQGHLWLKGTGDPTMLEAGYEELAAKVAASGVKVVEGGLVADDTWFDGVRLGHDWSWDDEPYSYAAQVSALTVSPDDDFDVGSVVVEVTPGETAGSPARVALVPQTDYTMVVDKVTTGAPGSSQDVGADRDHGTNTVVVTGSIPLGAGPARSPVSVWNPTGYAAAVFRKALADHGVAVNGPVSFGPTPADATEVAQAESMPLSQILVPLLKLSNNGEAEILLKTIGRQTHDAGSWDVGLQGMSERLAATAGLQTAGIRSRDGSGLSRQNLVSPGQLSTLLLAAQGREWYPAWYEALPIAGEADPLVGGTLRSRMTGTAAADNVHAKTGTLGSVSSLAGYVTGAGRQRLVFSIMLNNFVGPSPKDIEDAISVTLATFGDSEARAGDRARGGAKAGGNKPGRSTGPRPQRTIRVGSPTTFDASAVECSWIKSC
jgi:serine-type D-Ala-D-Ala carboxypeptidase/endopeptidase (penicillin-binding protein 4)